MIPVSLLHMLQQVMAVMPCVCVDLYHWLSLQSTFHFYVFTQLF